VGKKGKRSSPSGRVEYKIRGQISWGRNDLKNSLRKALQEKFSEIMKIESIRK